MERGGKGKTAIPEEEKADEPSILPMTPESKQLAAVIATAVAAVTNKIIRHLKGYGSGLS